MLRHGLALIWSLFVLALLTASPALARAPASPENPTLIPHTLAGRAACATCHGLAGRNPYPRDHVDIPSSACLRCHVPARLYRAPDTPMPPAVTNDFCLSCHAKPDLKMKLPSGEELDLHVDQASYARSVHGRKNMSCTACHPSNEKYPHEPFKGKSARELNRTTVQQGCKTCHADIFKQYEGSVHGKALIEESNLDVPGCGDCHGIHDIREPRTMLFRLESSDTCSTCHADAARMSKYGISANVTKTYLAEFHGKTISTRNKMTPGFASYEAVCYDCHGIHDIKKANDPESSVVAARLAEACQRCHPGAAPSFPSAWMGHYEPDRQSKWALVYWVNMFYQLLIPATVLGMGGFIGLDLFRGVLDRIRARRRGEKKAPHEDPGERVFVRFSLSQRMEHLVLIVSFTALCVTGLAQRFSTYATGAFVLRMLGGIDVARGIHRTFAVVMILECVYHAAALGAALASRRLKPSIIPRVQDAKDAFQLIFYFLGIKKDRPRFDRYDFKQKMEYFLLLWGTAVMTVSGLILWFPVIATRYLPGQLVPAAAVAHAGEAVLAAFAIFVWHMYSAHLNLDVFPFDKAIFTGKLSLSRMRHEHPVELERILAAEKNEAAKGAEAKRPAPPPAEPTPPPLGGLPAPH